MVTELNAVVYDILFPRILLSEYGTFQPRPSFAMDEARKKHRSVFQESVDCRKKRESIRSTLLREEANVILGSLSLSLQQPSLSSWPFSECHSLLDFYNCCSFEPMYSFHLGLSKLLKTCAMLRLQSDQLKSSTMLTKAGQLRQFSRIRTHVLRSCNIFLK